MSMSGLMQGIAYAMTVLVVCLVVYITAGQAVLGAFENIANANMQIPAGNQFNITGSVFSSGETTLAVITIAAVLIAFFYGFMRGIDDEQVDIPVKLWR